MAIWVKSGIVLGAFVGLGYGVMQLTTPDPEKYLEVLLYVNFFSIFRAFRLSFETKQERKVVR
jgi:hypothetical protein